MSEIDVQEELPFIDITGIEFLIDLRDREPVIDLTGVTIREEDRIELGSVISDTEVKEREAKYTREFLSLQREKASKVITDLKYSREQAESYNESDDAAEARQSKNKLSNYERDANINAGLGFIKADRFFYHKTSHEIDKTIKSTFYVKPPLCTTKDDSEYYRLDKSKYNEVVTYLSPRVKTREYGRVFFNTVTRYLPTDIIVRPRIKPTKIRGYIREGNRKKYWPAGLYWNKNCGTLFNRQKGYHREKGIGILKTCTPAGKVAELIFWNVQAAKKHWSYRPGTFARTSYEELKQFIDLDTTAWALSVRKQFPLFYVEGVEKHYDNYYEKYLLRNAEVDIVDEEYKTCQNIIQQIQAFWKIKSLRRKKASKIIYKFWNEKVISRSLGNTRDVYIPTASYDCMDE
jgi:hypothetical protein